MESARDISHIPELTNRLTRKGARVAAALDNCDRRDLQLLALLTSTNEDEAIRRLNAKVNERLAGAGSRGRRSYEISAGKREDRCR